MNASPLKVISSMATRRVLADLSAQYEQATGQPVVAEAVGGVDVAKRVRAGETVDVVVLASGVIDKLIDEGKLLGGSRVDIVESPIAAAIRAGTSRPDIASEEAVRQALLAAKSLSYSTGPSGSYLESTFERWEILDSIRDRIVVPPPGVPVAQLVAEGTAEIGFQQLSELMDRPGIEVLGLLPPEIQSLTVFSGAVTASCTRPDAARALLDYMGSPDVADIKRKYGLESAG